MYGKLDEKHLVLLSIIYQLVDSDGDIEELNPHIQEYLQGLCDEFNESDPEDEEYYQHLYHYADTFFNNLYGGKERLN